MDGVRACWNGIHLISRQGKDIDTPRWFTEGLPNIQLDGELWMGRGTFQELMNVLHSKEVVDMDWASIGYHIFDLPDYKASYEERIEQMKQLKPLPTHVHIVENIECTGREHLIAYLQSIVFKEGEGVMARQPHSLYIKGLTNSLLKVKVTISFSVE